MVGLLHFPEPPPPPGCSPEMRAAYEIERMQREAEDARATRYALCMAGLITAAITSFAVWFANLPPREFLATSGGF